MENKKGTNNRRYCFFFWEGGGGRVASWLVRATPERAVGQGHPVICWGNLTNCGEVACDGLASRPGEVGILPAASCYRNRAKLRQL